MNPTPQQYWEAGKYAFDQGEYAIAARCFGATIHGGLSEVNVWNNFGCALVLSGELDRARWAFREALSLNSHAGFVWNNYGRLLLRTQEWRSAADAFANAQGEDPASIVAAEAFAWLKEGSVQRAATIIERHLETHAPDDKLELLLLEAYLKTGDRKRAFDLLKKANPADLGPEKRLLLASLLIEQGNAAEALPLLAETAHRPGLATRATYLRLLALLLSGDTEAVALALSNAVLPPDQTARLRAWLAMAEARHEDAVALWEDLVAQMPHAQLPVWGLVQALHLSGNTEKWQLALRDFLEKYPDHSPAVWMQIQHWKAVPGSHKEMGKWLDKMVLLRGKWAEARIERGFFTLSRGMAEQAIADFQRATRSSPDSYDAWLGLGLAYQEAEKEKLSLEAFQQLATRYPQEAAAWWNLALAASSAEQWRIAVEAISNYLTFRPEDLTAYGIRAEALFALGRVRDAGEDWRRAGDVRRG